MITNRSHASLSLSSQVCVTVRLLTVNYFTLVFICVIGRYTDGLMVSVGSVVGGTDSFSHRKEHSREERQALSAKPDQNELVSGADP